MDFVKNNGVNKCTSHFFVQKLGPINVRKFAYRWRE